MSRVLFVGNSLTYLESPEESHDLPSLVSRLGERCGLRLETGRLSTEGATLREHLADGRLEKALEGGWDFAVFQDYSTRPLEAPQDYEADVRSCADATRRAGAQTVLFAPWVARELGAGAAAKVEAACRLAGTRLGAPVARVGAAWFAAAPGVPELYAADGEHASPFGAFLAACVMLALLAPEALEGASEQALSGGEFSPALAGRLRTAALETLV